MKAMKTLKLRYIVAALLVAPLVSGCLKDNNPTSIATDDQLENADKSGLSNAIAGHMISYGTDTYGDAGFAGFAIYRDAMTTDFPVCDASYDYFSDYNYQVYIGNTMQQTLFWRRYYYLIQKCNIVLGVVNPDEVPIEGVYKGNALAYRAMAYLDIARMYEYRRTALETLDAAAQAKGVMGLTVPIVTEKTSNSDARNNPRVTFPVMYRFIATDLDNAETCLSETHTVASKTNASLGVVYGLKARFYLEIGTRFENHPEDLQTMIAADGGDSEYHSLGISSAADCFSLAAKYARKAINEGYVPLSEGQWFDPKSGFNTPNSSWLWCITYSPDCDAVNQTWQSYVSYICPEATWGVADISYNAGRMIDAALFSKIPDSDWRKTTWIDPLDMLSTDAYSKKYAKGTSMDYTEWKKYKNYTGFKFHPGNGERITSTVGNAVSVPLMRVEEMYLIEAEAVGRGESVEKGKQLLEQFVNTYRYTDGSYSSNAASEKNLVDDIFTQKRIELWGEGLIMWDYKRLEKPIVRGYSGTNHPSVYLYNSEPNAVAPWLNFYIPDSERDFNKACILNPDPSSAYTVLWTE